MIAEEGLPEVTLYYGDNGQHEFWESVSVSRPGPGGLLLIHGDPDWIGEVRRLGLPTEWHRAATLEELVRMLARLLGWRIVLSDSARWEEPWTLVRSTGGMRMALRALDPAVALPYESPL